MVSLKILTDNLLPQSPLPTHTILTVPFGPPSFLFLSSFYPPPPPFKVLNDADWGLHGFLEKGDAVAAAADGKGITMPTALKLACEKKVQRLLLSATSDRRNARVPLDAAMQSVINKSASDIIKVCLPNGLTLPFLQNNFR